jgi:hypothetical protein
MAKKKPRNSGISSQSLLIPFNVLDFGDPEKDPCFGKLHDLTDEDCLSCGDIEWCATVFQQKLVQRRLAEEKKGASYDLEISILEHHQDIKDKYSSLIKEGYKPLKAMMITARRYNNKITNIKKIIDG